MGLLSRVIGNSFTVLAEKEEKVVGLLISKALTSAQYTAPDAGRQVGLSRILKELYEKKSEVLPDQFVYLDILAVSLDHQKLGIGGKLVDWVIERAKEEGVKFLLTEASGIYSQKIFDSKGFRTISEIKYSENKDEEGVRVFKHTDPHPSLKLMVLNVNE